MRVALGQVLGEGHFGVVYKAMLDTQDGNKIEVAVKTVKSMGLPIISIFQTMCLILR